MRDRTAIIGYLSRNGGDRWLRGLVSRLLKEDGVTETLDELIRKHGRKAHIDDEVVRENWRKHDERTQEMALATTKKAKLVSTDKTAPVKKMIPTEGEVAKVGKRIQTAAKEAMATAKEKAVPCVKRQDIEERFRVEAGMITSPCGYCGCAAYVPAMWETFLKNSGQTTKDYPVGKEVDIRVSEECRKEYPELGDRTHIHLRICDRKWMGDNKKRIVEL